MWQTHLVGFLLDMLWRWGSEGAQVSSVPFVDNKMARLPFPRATSFSLIQRLADRYVIDAELQKLLPTPNSWEYRGDLWYHAN